VAVQISFWFTYIFPQRKRWLVPPDYFLLTFRSSVKFTSCALVSAYRIRLFWADQSLLECDPRSPPFPSISSPLLFLKDSFLSSWTEKRRAPKLKENPNYCSFFYRLTSITQECPGIFFFALFSLFSLQPASSFTPSFPRVLCTLCPPIVFFYDVPRFISSLPTHLSPLTLS